MEKDIKKEEIRFEHVQAIIRLLLKISGPVMIMISGLVLLALRLAGWSLILGLPLVVIGAVFMIYTYDDVLSKEISHAHKDITNEKDGLTAEED